MNISGWLILAISAIAIGSGAIISCLSGEFRVGFVFPFANKPFRKDEMPIRFWTGISVMAAISLSLAIASVWQGLKVGFVLF